MGWRCCSVCCVVTGLLYWLLPHLIRRFSKQGQIRMAATSLLKASLRWHDASGRYAFALLMWVSFTGWCLRPPVLLALVGSKVPPVPGTLLDDDNAWNDKLRLLRYDPRVPTGFVNLRRFLCAVVARCCARKGSSGSSCQRHGIERMAERP